MSQPSTLEYTERYFQRAINDLSTERDRLRPRILELERMLIEWPDSAAIKKDLGKLKKKDDQLLSQIHRYLANQTRR